MGTILITGGSSGIGRATAKLLSQDGHKIIVCGRNEAQLQQTCQDVSDPSNTNYCVWDLSDLDAIPKQFKELVSEFGPFQGVFHAAGIEQVRALALTKTQSMDAVLHSSFYAGMLLAKAFAKSAAHDPEGSSLVLMSSVAAHRGSLGFSTYSAAKAAIEGAVRSLACELAPKIRVNAVAAGAVLTEMHERLVTHLSEESIDAYEKQHLLGFGKPEDVAEAACFLLGKRSRWITGTTLTVDGGYLCH